MTTMQWKQMEHQEFYELKGEDKTKYMEYIKDKIVLEKMDQPLLFKMAHIIEKAVTHYESDFYVHDYNTITKNPYTSNTYAWIVYDCGSHLIPMERNFEREAESSSDHYQTVVKNYYNKGAKTYILTIDKQSVKEIDPLTIQNEHFTNRNGDINIYFESKLNESTTDFSEYMTLKGKFISLMEECGNYPSKEKVDSIF